VENEVEADLTTLGGLDAAIYTSSPGESKELGTFPGTFCPRCHGSRRMRLASLVWWDRWAPQQAGQSFPSMDRGPDLTLVRRPDPGGLLGGLCPVRSRLCARRAQGPRRAGACGATRVLWGPGDSEDPTRSRLLPRPAHRARSVGAMSGAAAMYRALPWSSSSSTRATRTAYWLRRSASFWEMRLRLPGGSSLTRGTSN
jgi:hypothetical protein